MKIIAAIIASLLVASEAVCDVPKKLTCEPVASSPPTLDGVLTEWSDVVGIKTEMYSVLNGKAYAYEASYKCLYDATNIYFALEIPGDFRFDATNDHLCAAIATMFKVGSKATFLSMGGCPDALGGCSDGFPASCEDYTVDIGAHWELSGTQQGKLYPMDATSGSGGGDLVANKDDKYAASPYCRPEDDGEAAANEWSGAWAHSNPEIGEEGNYVFEMSRLLTTMSQTTDIQLAAGETYSFGIAFWDPFETEEEGWSNPGHYVTGCANQWIDLELKAASSGGDLDSKVASPPSGGWVVGVNTLLYVATVAVWMVL